MATGITEATKTGRSTMGRTDGQHTKLTVEELELQASRLGLRAGELEARLVEARRRLAGARREYDQLMGAPLDVVEPFEFSRELKAVVGASELLEACRGLQRTVWSPNTSFELTESPEWAAMCGAAAKCGG